MTRSFALAVAVAVAFAGVAAAQPLPKQPARPAIQLAAGPFKSPAGKYSVYYPVVPTESVRKVKLPDGGEMSVFTTTAKLGTTAYSVTYNDLPRKEGDPQKHLDAAVKGGRRGLPGPDGKVADADDTGKPITLGDAPGREYTIELAGGNASRTRVFLHEWRMYHVAVVTTKDRVAGPAVTKFLDSFKFEAAGAGPAVAGFRVKYRSADGTFSTLFPAKPTESSRPEKLPEGPVTFNTAQVQKDGAEFVVLHYDLPNKDAEPKAALDAAVKWVRQSSPGPDGKVVDADDAGKPITLGNDFGRDVLIPQAKDKVIRVRLYVHDKRMYQIIYSGPKAGSTEPAVTIFFDTFKFLK